MLKPWLNLNYVLCFLLEECYTDWLCLASFRLIHMHINSYASSSIHFNVICLIMLWQCDSQAVIKKKKKEGALQQKLKQTNFKRIAPCYHAAMAAQLTSWSDWADLLWWSAKKLHTFAIDAMPDLVKMRPYISIFTAVFILSLLAISSNNKCFMQILSAVASRLSLPVTWPKNLWNFSLTCLTRRPLSKLKFPPKTKQKIP